MKSIDNISILDYRNLKIGEKIRLASTRPSVIKNRATLRAMFYLHKQNPERFSELKIKQHSIENPTDLGYSAQLTEISHDQPHVISIRLEPLIPLFHR